MWRPARRTNTCSRSIVSSRSLSWPGCYNARDLGGLPLVVGERAAARAAERRQGALAEIAACQVFVARRGVARLAEEFGQDFFVVVLLDDHRFTAVMLK